MDGKIIPDDLLPDDVSLPSLDNNSDSDIEFENVEVTVETNRTSILIDRTGAFKDGILAEGNLNDCLLPSSKDMALTPENRRKQSMRPSYVIVGNKLAEQSLRMKYQSSKNLEELSANQYDQILQLLPSSLFDDIAENAKEDGVLERPVEMVGALMIADVSGFSTLSSLLEKSAGSQGADRMSQFLNKYFGHMIEIIEEHGGDVLKFAGDALVCVFKKNMHYDAAYICRSACEAGLKLIEQLTNFKVEDAINTFSSCRGNIWYILWTAFGG